MLKRTKPVVRSKRGGMGALFCALALVITFGIGAFAIDSSHVAAIRHQLQNAADAAAIAGAMDLSNQPQNCQNDAVAVAQQNTADNIAIASSAKPMTVSVSVDQTKAPGTVTVAVTMQVRHLFAGIFGDCSTPITVQATAGSVGKLTGMYSGGAFPLAVAGSAVSTATVGSQVTLILNSDKIKNAAFTSLTVQSANANWITNAIDEALGLTPRQQVSIPSVEVGDQIYLNNGIDGQKALANDPDYSAIMQQNVIYLPVINGDPAFVQSMECVGFVGLKITSINKDSRNGIVETITATVLQPVTAGMSMPAIPSSGNAQLDVALNGFAPGVVKLIQ